MTFSDDDLKRLSQQLRQCDIRSSAEIKIKEIKALLARLEAAEEYIKEHPCNYANCISGPKHSKAAGHD